jgi:hypothetical protein
MTTTRIGIWVAALAAFLSACHPTAQMPAGIFPETAEGGWRRTALHDLPASEAPDPVPRTSIEHIQAASYSGPGDLDARVYVLSAQAVAFELTQRWRPSADTVFFNHGQFFVVIKWKSADRKLLQEFVAGLEKRLASADGGKQ